jgi:excisionase family DNA binding protein
MASKNEQIRDTEENLWSRARAAQYLGVSLRTLQRLLQEGSGPCGARVGAQIRFRPADVRAYFNSCETVGGSEQKRRRVG